MYVLYRISIHLETQICSQREKGQLGGCVGRAGADGGERQTLPSDQKSTKRGTNSKTTGRRTTHHKTHHLHDLKTTKPGLDTKLPTRQRDEYLHARNGAFPAQGRQRGNGVLSGNATTSNTKRGMQVGD